MSMDEALKTTWMRDALAWVTQAQDKTTEGGHSVYQWLWEAIQGDFSEDRTTGQIAFDAAISMIPLVDQVCDVRDLVANCRKLKQDLSDTWAWVSLGLTLIGLFPTLGSLLKGVLKIMFMLIRRYGLDQLLTALDKGMTWVVTFLRKREVLKYWRGLKVDEVFSWLAGEVRRLRGRVNTGALLVAFDRGVAVLQELLGKIDWMPGVAEKAKATLTTVLDVRKAADKHIGEAVEPLQKILDAFATRLEREARIARSAVHGTTNIHFRGGLPQASAITLMKGDPKPKWLSKGDVGEYPGIDIRNKDNDDLAKKIQASIANKDDRYPDIMPDPNDPDDIGLVGTFHTVKAAKITGPARLYRILSPSSKAMSDCWVSEEVFDLLQKSPDPRAAWRKYLGVWPHWNANGQFVIYDVKPGETLNVWRGTTASQVDKELGAHLEGGWEQIVFNVPSTSSFNDAMAFYERLPDGKLRGPLPASEAKALGREKTVMLRQQIMHPNIRGPYETGWGYTDFEHEMLDARIGLPTLPGQVTN
jgi:hypothetical protein